MGFETLSDLGPCVSIFGSARVKPENPLYAEGETIAKLLVESGYGVITGGGPGLMEAGNKGATEAGGTSVGLHIQLPHEQECNKYVKIRSDYRYFFLRKLMFVKYALAYVVMPGGMGTIDELSEAFVLAQTKRIRPLPIILYQSTFWNGFLDWVRSTMVSGGYIRASEVDDLHHGPVTRRPNRSFSRFAGGSSCNDVSHQAALRIGVSFGRPFSETVW